jgi:hypothetical protein
VRAPVLLVVDSRRRISLGALARHGTLHAQYLVVMDDDGTIELRPAVVMPLERSHELHRVEKILREQQARLDDEPPF